MPIIKLKKICKTYYTGEVSTPVLHDINLEIEKGEFVAIMGPSGAGKSTLLHILGFLDDQTSGMYIFGGKRMHTYSEEEKAHVRNEKLGFVFQSFNLLSRTSVLENVKLPLLYSKEKLSNWDDIAEKAIESVGLSHRLDHHPSQLSGGEKQRVAIARSLVNNPSVIFADEPTGNLDTHSSAGIMKIFQKLNKDGHTVILITHEPDIAKYARRTIHIVDGRVDRDTKKRETRSQKSE